MKRKTKSIIIGAAAAVSTAAALTTVYYASAKRLIGIALDRKAPRVSDRSRARLSGFSDLDTILKSAGQGADKLKTADCETVEITSTDGTRLVGHWYCPENPKRVIVAMHGWRSAWYRDFGMIAPFWHSNDCAVLYAEQRGQGESGGDYMGFGLLERYDCLNWVNWVNERTEGKTPIYLGGVSMGATTILMTAGFTLPSSVHGIIADCGFTSPHAIWQHVAKNNLRIPYGLYKNLAGDICKRKIQEGPMDYSCIDAMKACRVPVLFIHGTDDRFVPIEMTYENFKACASPKRLFIVPGAQHGLSYYVDRDGYETAVKSFWREYD